MAFETVRLTVRREPESKKTKPTTGEDGLGCCREKVVAATSSGEVSSRLLCKGWIREHKENTTTIILLSTIKSDQCDSWSLPTHQLLP
jgi:hypothetical protein